MLNRKEIILPMYICMVLKEFSHIRIAEQTISIKATIVFRIYVQDLA